MGGRARSTIWPLDPPLPASISRVGPPWPSASATVAPRISTCFENGPSIVVVCVISSAGTHISVVWSFNQAPPISRCTEPRSASVNVSELHDCLTVIGAIGAEVIGKAEPGQGARYWADGKAAVDGECAINTSGGLIAKGHAIGLTGVAMVGWTTTMCSLLPIRGHE